MLILVAHGSRDSRWRTSVEETVSLLQSEVGADRVRLAYMECAPPTLAEVTAEAVGSGASSIRVLPLFLAAEGHVERHVRPLVDELRDLHGAVDITLLPPMGRQPLFLTTLRDIALDEACQG